MDMKYILTTKDGEHKFEKISYLPNKKLLKLYCDEVVVERIYLSDITKFVGKSWDGKSVEEKEKIVKSFIP